LGDAIAGAASSAHGNLRFLLRWQKIQAFSTLASGAEIIAAGV